MPAGSRLRWVTAAPYRNRLSDAQILEIERNMTDEYRQHKRAMHRAGARAASKTTRTRSLKRTATLFTSRHFRVKGA